MVSRITHKRASDFIGTDFILANKLIAKLEARNNKRNLFTKPDISLMDFVLGAWSTIEPGKEFVPNWSIEVIVQHLEQVSLGNIKRLLINVPPRHSKSIICSILWPVWEWTFNPSSQWLSVSNTSPLAIKFASKSRRLINSPWFQARWGHRFKLLKEQNAKSRYENNYEGIRFGTGITSSIIGENADRIIVDDPHDAKKVESDDVRQNILDCYDLSVSTRLNNANASIVVIGQRVHENDLFAHLIETKEFEHLFLPTYYEETNPCITSLGKVDKREKEGELLWPERFDEKVIARAKKTLQIYGFSAQHQQRPTPRTGGLFKLEDFQYIEKSKLPRMLKLHRHWDLAATASDKADYTAGVKLGIDQDNKIYVLNVVRKQLTPQKVEDLIKNTAINDTQDCSITIELEKGASGKHVTDHYKHKVLKGFAVKAQPLWGDKVTRAGAFSSEVEARNVYLVIDDWNDSYTEELCKFPKSDHKDQVDGSSGAYKAISGFINFDLDDIEESENEYNFPNAN